jgi:hypothetical protein
MFGWFTLAAARASRQNRLRETFAAGQGRRDGFQRDGSLQTFIVRGVHDPHAAFSELALQRVMADARGTAGGASAAVAGRAASVEGVEPANQSESARRQPRRALSSGSRATAEILTAKAARNGLAAVGRARVRSDGGSELAHSGGTTICWRRPAVRHRNEGQLVAAAAAIAIPRLAGQSLVRSNRLATSRTGRRVRASSSGAKFRSGT